MRTQSASGITFDVVGVGVTPYPWPTFGIYLDEGSSHCTVYGNVVLRSGVGAIINPGEFNTLENNVFAGNTVGIFFQAVPPLDKLRPPLGGNRFVHNIIVLAKGENFGYNLRNWTDKTLAVSDFNLFWKAGGTFHLQTQSALDKPLTTRTLTDWQRMGYDRHSEVGDPLFVHPSANDYRLRPSSPAGRLGFVPIDLSTAGIRPVQTTSF